jgi:putative transposase
LVVRERLMQAGRMNKAPDTPFGQRFPTEIISHAAWLYNVFSLSLRNVELLLAETGMIVSYESVRHWCLRFGHGFAQESRRSSFNREGSRFRLRS